MGAYAGSKKAVKLRAVGASRPFACVFFFCGLATDLAAFRLAPNAERSVPDVNGIAGFNQGLQEQIPLLRPHDLRGVLCANRARKTAENDDGPALVALPFLLDKIQRCVFIEYLLSIVLPIIKYFIWSYLRAHVLLFFFIFISVSSKKNHDDPCYTS